MQTEKRLIDALDAERPANPETQYDIGYNNGLTMAIAIVAKTDAVEVVRCRDCKHQDAMYCWRPQEDHNPERVGSDDFCSCGERRTDG